MQEGARRKAERSGEPAPAVPVSPSLDYAARMLIGILSDTHDRLEAARAAVQRLRQRGAEYLIHCGDVGGQEVLDELAGVPTAFVWGNNDWDRIALARYAEEIGLSCYGSFA